MILTQQNLISIENAPTFKPFDDKIVEWLNDVSKVLLADKEAKAYPDVITFAFWIRKASIENLKKRFLTDDFRLGRGVCFHVAPSNVPVNYAYSLVAGLICGNKNIVRIPSKDFKQVEIINNAFKKCGEFSPYINLVQYGHDKELNDLYSNISDVRIIWGGDNTIRTFRESQLKPRATEIVFADRYSLAIIDADVYLSMDKNKVALDFYNDTYLTDQNACTSPRVVIWYGNKIDEAKKIFWEELYNVLISKKYEIKGVQAVNKLTSGYLLASLYDGVKKVITNDNLIIRMKVSKLSASLMDIKDNSGYFFEYTMKNIDELRDICDNSHLQTLSYIGKNDIIKPLVEDGIKGIDRIVPIGKTMDFDLLWDGYNLFERLTRNVVII